MGVQSCFCASSIKSAIALSQSGPVVRASGRASLQRSFPELPVDWRMSVILLKSTGVHRFVGCFSCPRYSIEMQPKVQTDICELGEPHGTTQVS